MKNIHAIVVNAKSKEEAEKIDNIMSGQAEGAIPNGTRVEKQNAESGDTHPNGSIGTVTASVAVPPSVMKDAPDNIKDVKFGYFVKWDGSPIPFPVFCIDRKIKTIN